MASRPALADLLGSTVPSLVTTLAPAPLLAQPAFRTSL